VAEVAPNLRKQGSCSKLAPLPRLYAGGAQTAIYCKQKTGIEGAEKKDVKNAKTKPLNY
jgi:hypothetical protein